MEGQQKYYVTLDMMFVNYKKMNMALEPIAARWDAPAKFFVKQRSIRYVESKILWR
jgi:hypothetical protein